MTLVDSCDSIFMLHAYALPSWGDPSEGRWYQRIKLWEVRKDEGEDCEVEKVEIPAVVASEKLVTVQILLTVISIMIALLISIVCPEYLGGRSRLLMLVL